MKTRGKNILVAMLAASMVLGSSVPAFAADAGSESRTNPAQNIIQAEGEETVSVDAAASVTPGWNKDSVGDWYYADSNGILQSGWQKIDGTWYYFDEDTYQMCADETRWIDGTTYAFSSSGAMITGWYKDFWGDWYYFESSGKGAQGWKKLNNKWYYFSYGWMYSDGFQECENGKYYLFDVSGAWISGSGWKYWCKQYIDGDYGHWYYMESDGSARIGWSKIDGTWYCFSEYGGFMYADGDHNIDGNIYLFDASGAWISGNGWYQYTYKKKYDGQSCSYGTWYYLKNGIAQTGMQTINGKQYFLDEGWGVMYAGTYFCRDGVNYFAADDGTVTKAAQGWKKGTYSVVQNGKKYTYTQWYYFGTGGSTYTGWLKSGNSWYYLDDSKAVTDGSINVDGTIYVFDMNGVLLIDKAGWYHSTRFINSYGYCYYNSDWYYVNSEGIAYTGWQKIGGVWYYFADWSGYMYSDTVEWCDDAYYGFAESGAMVVGWHQFSYGEIGEMTWFYFDQNGKGHDGWLKSGNSWYYIDDGYMYYGGTFVIDGRKSRFANDGKWLGYV